MNLVQAEPRCLAAGWQGRRFELCPLPQCMLTRGALCMSPCPPLPAPAPAELPAPVWSQPGSGQAPGSGGSCVLEADVGQHLQGSIPPTLRKLTLTSPSVLLPFFLPFLLPQQPARATSTGNPPSTSDTVSVHAGCRACSPARVSVRGMGGDVGRRGVGELGCGASVPATPPESSKKKAALGCVLHGRMIAGSPGSVGYRERAGAGHR